MDKQYCYIVRSCKKTYIGYTVNPNRRIRQHRGELKGGAKATSCAKDWEFLAIITSDSPVFTKILALSIEWHLKHPSNKKRDASYWGIEGRLKGIIEVLNRYSIDFTVYVDEDYKVQLEALRDIAEGRKDLTNPVNNVINIKALVELVL
jgi:structure-specific endonuclease subunit SLX1